MLIITFIDTELGTSNVVIGEAINGRDNLSINDLTSLINEMQIATKLHTEATKDLRHSIKEMEMLKEGR
jgi:hypothetical protein